MKSLMFALAMLAAPIALASTPPPPPAATVEQLQSRLGELLVQERIPGMGLALLKNHRVLWVGGVGMADVENQVPVNADTPFLVGSISKSFTALAVMTLVEAGKIDLDAPIRRYLPDAPIDNPWEATHPVTVAQVLEHTAGFDDLSLRNFVTERHNLPVQTAVPESAAAFRVRWPPGQRYSYSNPG
jgi:CubicO group peptidase (beta-lactamase class C family)